MISRLERALRGRRRGDSSHAGVWKQVLRPLHGTGEHHAHDRLRLAERGSQTGTGAVRPGLLGALRRLQAFKRPMPPPIFLSAHYAHRSCRRSGFSGFFSTVSNCLIFAAPCKNLAAIRGIRQLAVQPEPKRRPIGFVVPEDKSGKNACRK